MIRSIVFACCFMLAGWLPAQQEIARLDLSRKEPIPNHIEYVFADGGLVTLGSMSRKSNRYLGVTKYDENFEQVWTQEVLQQNGRASIDLMTVLGDEIFVFISEYHPRERAIKTSYTSFDLEGNRVAERVEIAVQDNEKTYRTDLKYTRSINKRKLLCYKNLDEGAKQEKILYYLFDAENDQIIDGKMVLPYPDDKFTVRNITVSNSGNIYVLGKFYMVNRVKSPDDFGFKIYKFEPGNPEPTSVNIDLGDLYLTDLTLKVDRSENIFLAGFYSHKSTNEIIGTAFFRIDPDLQVEMSSSQRFSDDFLNVFLREKQIEKGKELKHFYLDNIILRSDGGVLLIAEKYYTSYSTYLDPQGYSVDRKVHHYDDIIVNSVAANGDLEWSAVAAKAQNSELRQNLSYIDIVSGSGLFLIYGYQPRRGPMSLYYNAIDMDGHVDLRKLLFGGDSMYDSFYPKLSEQISNTDALLVYYREKEKIFTIIRMSFE